VDERLRIVAPGDVDQAGQIDDGAFHREDAVAHDQLSGIAREPRELLVERREVAVRVAMHLAVREARAIDQRRVVELVEEEMLAPADKLRDRADARLIAGREHQRSFLAEESGELCLELVMEIERAVEQTAAGGSAAVLRERGAR